MFDARETSRPLKTLRRFAAAITVLNLLGHSVLGFEQPWAAPFVALATAYATELLLEAVNAWSDRRRPRFFGSFGTLIDFLLSAHITGLATGMLLYPGDRLQWTAFAAGTAVASKAIFRVPIGQSSRHFLNPSNSGISFALIAFGVGLGVAQPYQFTENLFGIVDWIPMVVIVASGSLLNGKLTGRLPLIGGWLGGFVLQALLRHLLMGESLLASLAPLTGVSFILFSFYMVTDPATTPAERRCQVAFGMAVAAMYGLLMAFHVVFTLFYGLAMVCMLRGLSLYAWSVVPESTRSRATVLVPATLRGAE